MKAQFGECDYRILERESVSRGFLSIERMQLQHASFSSDRPLTVTREVMHRGEASAIMIHDPLLDLVVMVEQFRVGGVDSAPGPWFIEIPAGVIDAGETAEQAAIREAREETGVSLLTIEPVVSYFPSAGGSSEKVHLFYGTADLNGFEERVMGEESEGENVLARAIPFTEAVNGITSGAIRDVASIIAIYWMQRSAPSLMAI